MKGILIYTNANGRFLHDPALTPFFEYMNGQDKPIWIHPYFNPSRPDPELDLDWDGGDVQLGRKSLCHAVLVVCRHGRARCDQHL